MAPADHACVMPQALPTCESPTREERAPSFLSAHALVLGVALYAAVALDLLGGPARTHGGGVSSRLP